MVVLNRRAVMALALAVSSFAVAPIASAIDTQWSNAAGGLWLEPTNWTNGVPTSSDNAILSGSLSNVPNTLVTLDLGDAFISINSLIYSNDSGFDTSYDLTNGFLSTNTIRLNGFAVIDPVINIGLTTEFGTLSIGGFFNEGSFTVNKPIGLQTNSLAETFGTDSMRVRATGTFTAANTYTGRTIVVDQLNLSGVDGALASNGDPDGDNDITVRNGKLVLDNSVGINENRVLDTARTGVKSGVISVVGNEGNPVSENLGIINLESGENRIELLQQGGSLTVSAAALTRTPDNRATLILNNFGSIDPVTIGLDTDIPASELFGNDIHGTTAAPVLPWATAAVGNGETYLPATYDPTTKVLRPLSTSEYVLNTLSPGDNVVFDGNVTFPTVDTDTSVNSLAVPSGSAIDVNAKLTVNSGSLLLGSSLVFSGSQTIVSGTGSIELGDKTGYLLVAADFRRPEIATVINVPINTTGGLVKSGTGTLILGVDQPGLAGGITVNNGDLIPLTNNSLGTGTVTIAGGINGRGTGQQEARLFINTSVTLPNQLISKTFGEYDGYGVLWYSPIMITNNATLTLTADPGGDSYFSLQNQFTGERATLILASPTARPPSTGFGISINVFENSELILTGQTRNSLEAYGPLARLSGNGTTLNFLRLYSGAALLIGNDGISAQTLTGNSLTIFGGNVLMDIGGPTNSDLLVLTTNDEFLDPALFNADLQLSLLPGYTPTTGDLITLIDSIGTVTSFETTFIGKAEGQNFEFAGYNASLSYVGGDGNNVVLRIGTAIPEPASLALLAAPALLLTRRRR